MTPTLPLAFAAGLLSFLSPCVLPLVPSYLAYVGGGMGAARGSVIRNSLFFVLGFSLIFISLGASASLLGGLLRAYRFELSMVGAVLIIVFGLVTLGLKLPFTQRQARVHYTGQTQTPVGAALLGMAFAAGWTPCIGPVLGSVLTLAGTSGQLGQGVLLLSVYALGLAIPFLVAAGMLESFTRFSNRFRRYLPWVERVSGVILITAGIMLLTGTYTVLNGYLINLTPEWLQRLL